MSRHWRFVLELEAPLFIFSEFVNSLVMICFMSLLDFVLDVAPLAVSKTGPEPVAVHAGVPNLQTRHLAIGTHVLPIRLCAEPRTIVAFIAAQTKFTAGQGEARGEPLDVPLPGPGQR